MQIFFLIILFIIGACLGSFLCCQARRLRIRQQTSSKLPKRAKPPKSIKPAKSPKPQNSLGPRSVCLSCKYQLKWYDNIPIISWLILKGKCRKCGQKIGLTELLSELGVGLALLLLGTTIYPIIATPLEWTIFAFMLLLTLTLSFLAIYDGAYGELPSSCLTISIICAIIVLCLKEWLILSNSEFTPNQILDPLGAVLILGGVYLALYLISKGRWVGDGDWLLGTVIAIALGSAWLSLIVLFLSNLLACLVMLPLAKGKKALKIHFGPFLVVAFVIVYTCAEPLASLISF